MHIKPAVSTLFYVDHTTLSWAVFHACLWMRIAADKVAFPRFIFPEYLFVWP